MRAKEASGGGAGEARSEKVKSETNPTLPPAFWSVGSRETAKRGMGKGGPLGLTPYPIVLFNLF